MATERLAAVLAQEEPLGVILRDEALERAYRSALRVRQDDLLRYLASEMVLDDMLAALVNEGTPPSPLLPRMTLVSPWLGHLSSPCPLGIIPCMAL